MHRFFAKNLENNYFILEKEDVRQIQQVLKLKHHEKIICVYNNEHYITLIEVISPKNYLFKLEEKLNQNHESPVKITLIAGLIRNAKWDYLLQKATELGVHQIVPFQFKRCVVQLNGENAANKIMRWTKICKEASEQSYRNRIPIISNIENDIAKLAPYQSTLNLVCYENTDANLTLKTFLQQKWQDITIIVGPEGGFTDDEIKAFHKMQYNIVSLGQRILRAETASLAVLAMIMYQKEL